MGSVIWSDMSEYSHTYEECVRVTRKGKFFRKFPGNPPDNLSGGNKGYLLIQHQRFQSPVQTSHRFGILRAYVFAQ